MREPTLVARSGSAARRPVVLVHGWLPKPWIWDALRAALVRAGWAGRDVHAVRYDSLTLRVPEAAAVVDEVIERAATASPDGRVDVVAHSQGVLAARYAVKLGGSAARVATFVSLAGINHGTKIAVFAALNPIYRDLVPGSPLLQRLNAEPEAPPPTRWITYRVREDDRFAPPDGSELAGADNRAAPPSVSHAGLTGHRPTVNEIVDELVASAPTAGLTATGGPVRSGS
jgi:pimeloyl-ACP methyl ester carboxylesterase